MELIKCQMPETFNVYDTSDFHLGSPNCAEETLQGVLDIIRDDPKGYLLFKGDAIEAITPGDKRFTHTCVLERYKSPEYQAARIIEMVRPVQGKILAWMTGNHELKLQNIIEFGRHIAKQLDVPYGAYVCKLHYIGPSGRLMFKTFHTHGMGSVSSNAKDDIQYAANRAAALKHKLVKSGHSDCIYMSRGHDHQLIVVEPTVQNKLFLTDNGRGIKQHYHERARQNAKYIAPDSRWYATTGSFRRLYSKPGLGITDYGEMAGYAPAEIGYAKMVVENGVLQRVEKVIA